MDYKPETIDDIYHVWVLTLNGSPWGVRMTAQAAMDKVRSLTGEWTQKSDSIYEATTNTGAVFTVSAVGFENK